MTEHSLCWHSPAALPLLVKSSESPSSADDPCLESDWQVRSFSGRANEMEASRDH